MKCQRRYCLLFVFVTSLALLVVALYHAKGQRNDAVVTEIINQYHYIDDFEFSEGRHPNIYIDRQRSTNSTVGCRMSNCFNLTLCRQNGFRVYVYPPDNRIVSGKYSEILRALRSSRYYTDNPLNACLFVLAIDTLDRDKLSTEYVPDVQSQIDSLQWWNGGLNHVIFNLYSGTWPDYNENGLGFDIGQAMLAKASISQINYRPGFDISFPLFHKELSYRGGESGVLTSNAVIAVRKYLLSFKGKRYLTGIGSETRNSLYHIHNGQDIVLLTTCKHGKGWKSIKDDRCELDNAEYDRWDYKTLMLNSTFCLVPRGRRLGSYRFLESLQTACIPVLLSNDWVLPFSEVIDWNKATVMADERLLLQVPALVRSITPDVVLTMRHQTHLLWETYFSSVEKIVGTTLEIIKDRIDRETVRNRMVWNNAPGALAMVPEYSQSLARYPFYWRHLGVSYHATSSVATAMFTAVVYVTSRSTVPPSNIHKLMKTFSLCKQLHKVIILCQKLSCIQSAGRWPVKVPVVMKVISSVNERFQAFSEIETDAVFSLTDNVLLVRDELEFAFSVWRSFPDRLIGYNMRSHFWGDGSQSWRYSSKSANDYSMVLMNAAIYHRYYNFMYDTWLPRSLLLIVDQLSNCEDILFNFLVAHVSRHAPIKLTRHRSFSNWSDDVITDNVMLMEQRHYCLNVFSDEFDGKMSLFRSVLRLDPILYNDNVSITRKKYRQLESVTV